MAATPGHRYDVFLSHASADKPAVRAFADVLKSNDIHVWFDEWEAGIGKSRHALDEGIEATERIVIFWSANYKNSFGRDEYVAFREKHGSAQWAERLMVVKLDDLELEGLLRGSHPVDGKSVHAKEQVLKFCERSLVNPQPLSKALGPDGPEFLNLIKEVNKEVGQNITTPPTSVSQTSSVSITQEKSDETKLTIEEVRATPKVYEGHTVTVKFSFEVEPETTRNSFCEAWSLPKGETATAELLLSDGKPCWIVFSVEKLKELRPEKPANVTAHAKVLFGFIDGRMEWALQISNIKKKQKQKSEPKNWFRKWWQRFARAGPHSIGPNSIRQTHL